MRVVIFGATGMVGSGALLECLEDSRVTSVLVVVRKSLGMGHPRLREIVHRDFFDYSSLRTDFAACDACFFCLGVSAVGMSEADYRHLTYDLTLAAAKAMVAANRGMTFCYISGAGTDARGRMMWARVKGETENALLALPFKAAYMFRPGFIQPVKGVRTKTRWYALFYGLFAPLYPLLRRLLPRYLTDSQTLGRVLIGVAATGYPARILNPDDINRVAATA